MASWIAASNKFILVKPCELHVVLFNPYPALLNISSDESISELNSSGQVFLTLSNWQGQSIIRAALSNWSTNVQDVHIVIMTLNNL